MLKLFTDERIIFTGLGKSLTLSAVEEVFEKTRFRLSD